MILDRHNGHKTMVLRSGRFLSISDVESDQNMTEIDRTIRREENDIDGKYLRGPSSKIGWDVQGVS